MSLVSQIVKISERIPHTGRGLLVGFAVDSLDEVIKSGLASMFFNLKNSYLTIDNHVVKEGQYLQVLRSTVNDFKKKIV